MNEDKYPFDKVNVVESAEPKVQRFKDTIDESLSDTITENIDYIDEIETKFPETTKEFRRLQYEDYKIFCKKQKDYGPGNISLGSTLELEEDRRVSQSSIIFRCFDKIQRLMNLVVKQSQTSPANEPIEDAYADLSNYGLIARVVRNKRWNK